MTETVTPSPARRGRWAGPAPERAGFGGRFTTATSLGSVLNPVNSSIIAIALVAIGRSFGVGADATTWLVSALYVATAVGQPTAGRLADLFGPRRIYVAGSMLVGIGGLTGFLAQSLTVLVIARVIIGLGTSAAYPAAMAMVRRQSERLGTPAPGGVLSALAIAGWTSMAVGPPLGGLLIAIGGWRATLIVNVPLAAISLLCALLWLPADERRERGTSSRLRTFDPAGMVLFAVVLISLLVFLMDLTSPRWWLLGVSVVLLGVLIGWELRNPTPFLDVRMLATHRALTTTYLRYAVTMLVTYCFLYGWTMWLEQSAHFSSSATGLLMVPCFVVAAAGSALIARCGVWGPLLAGTVALTAASASLLLLHADSPLWLLVATSVLFGLQNGLNAVSNQSAMYRQAPASHTGSAAGLLRTFSYLGAIASASLISLTFGAQAEDHGLHHLALILTVGSAATILTVAFDRELRRKPTPAKLPDHGK
ncbi:MFS transporter [Amycolatopsis rhizosphaerae]|uniref:MFS transporter n=1 Tax=Amycolatopsis rhizosphaerae TaxID=2053003 RepID=UPI0016439733|nr:MFS transporter [Amycolatopsis rhizosphaerae]